MAAVALARAAVERSSRLGARRGSAIVLALALAACAAVTADLAVQFLCVLAVGMLGAVVVRLDAGLDAAALGPAQWLLSPWHATRLVVGSASRAVGGGIRSAIRDGGIAPLRGAAIALVAVAVFGGLLGAADPTFAAIGATLGGLMARLTGLGRVLFFIVAAFTMLGLLGLPSRSATPARASPGPAVHTDAERLIVLVSVATLFAAFLLLQAGYLFRNPGARAGSGVTFAEAVHHGFGEISVVVSLTAAVLLVLERRAAPGPRAAWVRWSAYAVLAECLLLLASAALRLGAYQSAYGYTRLRADLWLYLAGLGVLLLLLGAELHAGLRPARLCWNATAVAGAALLVLALANPAAWVVHANVDRYVATGALDWESLERTGPDGLAELARALPRLGPDGRARLAVACSRQAASAAADAWYEWNWRRAVARRVCREEIHGAP